LQQQKSAECGFHIGILRARQDVTVILHFQSPFATAIACSGKDYKYFNVITEIPYYIGAVAVIP
jgi:ribulose-5-phosphate 4-epimerase/fuculose-1-phosphate aldolase